MLLSVWGELDCGRTDPRRRTQAPRSTLALLHCYMQHTLHQRILPVPQTQVCQRRSAFVWCSQLQLCCSRTSLTKSLKLKAASYSSGESYIPAASLVVAVAQQSPRLAAASRQLAHRTATHIVSNGSCDKTNFDAR